MESLQRGGPALRDIRLTVARKENLPVFLPRTILSNSGVLHERDPCPFDKLRAV